MLSLLQVLAERGEVDLMCVEVLLAAEECRERFERFRR
jgi:hypothetical protein